MIQLVRALIFCKKIIHKMIRNKDINSNKSKFYSNYPKKMIFTLIMLKKNL